MLSHHAPPKRLLRNFASTNISDTKKLWVYSRDRPARGIHKVTSESAEHGYFKNDPQGRSEGVIEAELNERYEAPFNRVLPGITAGLAHTFDRSLVEVCAEYMGGIFLRSKPWREACKLHSYAFNQELKRRLGDPLTLRRYAAKLSLATRTSVPLHPVLSISEKLLQEELETEQVFFNSATTNWSLVPTYLRRSHWSICSSPELELLQSDVAVALLNTSQSGQITFGTGLARQGAEWYLPISPHVALRASAEHISSSVLSFDQANLINEFMVRAAHSFVFSQRYSADVEDFTSRNIYSLHFFRDMLVSNVAAEVETMITGLLTPEERVRLDTRQGEASS